MGIAIENPLIFSLQPLFVFIVLSAYLGAALFKKFHWSLGVGYFYVSGISAIKIVYAREVYKEFDIANIAGFEALVAEAYLFLTLLAIGALLINRIHKSLILDFFLGISFLNALVMLVKYLTYFNVDTHKLATTPYFLFNNSATDVGFLACTIPLFLQIFSGKIRWFFLVPIIFICIVTSTSTGILGLGTSVGVYYGLQILPKVGKKVALAFVTLFGGMVGLLGYSLQRGVLFNGSGRYELWKGVWEYFSHTNRFDQMIGKGAGTYLMYGPAIQIADAIKTLTNIEGVKITQFPTLHNDWFQILFETGVEGLLLAIAIFAAAVYKARYKPAICAALVTFGAVALVQMPLRWPLFACLGSFLIVCAFEKPVGQYD